MPKDSTKIYLLPHYLQKVGGLFLIIGLLALYLRFVVGIKPAWLEIKVFAFYSAIFDSKYFSIVGNNISEEIGLLFTGSGLFLLTLAKEKVENSQVWKLRVQAFIYSFYTNAVIFIFFVIFIYGWGFMAYMGANLFIPMITYNVIFRFLMHKLRTKHV